MKTCISVHFIGICGTAMASVADMMKSLGHTVTGSDDSVYPPMSTFLEKQNISFFHQFSDKNLSHNPDIVVIGNKISRGNPEAEGVLRRKMNFTSLSELIKHHFIQGKNSIVVAGTHGKTTTTSLISWIFDQSGLEPGFMIGGIPVNFGKGCRIGNGEYFIIEGDEYDTAFFDKRAKFLHYLPTYFIINNIEFDHADIYSSLDEILTAFERGLRLVPDNGAVIANADDDNVAKVLRMAHKNIPVITFGFNSMADWQIKNIDFSSDKTTFILDNNNKTYQFTIPLFGRHNVYNATASVITGIMNGIKPDSIQNALLSFKNVRRRMDVFACVNGITLIDDFAHHPTAYRETLKSVRQRYPHSRITAVIEPRTNTMRRNIFQQQIVTSFSSADQIIIAPVHEPERYSEDERFLPFKLVTDLREKGKDAFEFDSIDSIVTYLAEDLKKNDVAVLMSNGGFGGIHKKLQEAVQK